MWLFYFFVVLWVLASSVAFAYDPSPLQDFCVAINDTKTGVFVNGKLCQDPKLAKAEDFFFSGLGPGDTSNPLGSKVAAVTILHLTHPRGTEILVVLEGTLYVGFVASNQNDNRLFTKVLNKGDVFVFPIGLIHFQQNIGYGNALAIAGLSSQNPGVISIANAVFGSKPPISDEVLAKAFQVDKNVIDYLQKQFWYNNS
ncbi:hypothetical protein GLYMA_10G168800v4 [Glycine max]|uniref:Germin-like protein n=1 Tax=Glycine max TaxID=3847 RepID=K7LJV8_SOYBN|nr:hypothetical protein GLYMA_10G168800v4 [Glycine max]